MKKAERPERGRFSTAAPGLAMDVEKRARRLMRDFYTVVIALFFLVLEALIILLFRPSGILKVGWIIGLFVIAFLLAQALVSFQVWDALRHGPDFILKRWSARAPDLRTPEEARFEDRLEVLRKAAGRPWIKPYVITHSSFNAAALVEADGTPALAVTTGMLSGLPPEERDAVLIFELALMAGKGAVERTVVCGLADFLERVAGALFPSSRAVHRTAARWAKPIKKRLARLFDTADIIAADQDVTDKLGDARALAAALFNAREKNNREGCPRPASSPLYFALPNDTGGWPPPRPSTAERLVRLKEISGGPPTDRGAQPIPPGKP